MTFYRWAIIAALLLGAALGVAGFTFVYARGASYLTNDPAACANCHIMQEHFSGWIKSSHRSAATCNDCHTPHTSLVAKYTTKATNGFWHSLGFTTGRFPDPLRIKPRNHRITEHACRYCHAEITDAIEHGTGVGPEARAEQEISCVRCHRYVGHWVR
jgi:cytochrome c nitrite reductase small subunit